MKEKPKVAFFDFASCEGDQLQIANLEEKILDLLELVEIVSFREIMKEHSDDYDVAFIEGSIQRPKDEERLKKIRENAGMLVAFGNCATNGNVNKLQKDWSIEEVKDEVYPDLDEDISKSDFFDNFPSKAVDEVVKVDYYIRGCPVRGDRVLQFVEKLVKKPVSTNKDIDFKVILKDKGVDERSLVKYNPDKCILCRRCANFCQDVMSVDALGPVERGFETIISTPKDIGFDANGCIHCGQCVALCPVDSLFTDSPVEDLSNDLVDENQENIIVLDSIAMASFLQEHSILSEMEPKQAERYLIGGLKKMGFDRVLQYDRFLELSKELDDDNEKPVLASWCLPARNHIEAEGIDNLAIESNNTPWNLILEEEDGNICLMSPCSGLKAVEEIDHVISAPEMIDLFNHMDIDIGFVDPSLGDYDGPCASEGFKHSGIPGYDEYFKVTEKLADELLESDNKSGAVNVVPCLYGCLSGGGNHPTADEKKVLERKEIVMDLREVKP